MVARTFMALYLRLFSGLSEQFLTIITNNLLNLTDKDLNQDRRIENLEKMFFFFKNYDFYTRAKAKKTRYAHNLGRYHPNVEGIDAKKTMPKG